MGLDNIYKVVGLSVFILIFPVVTAYSEMSHYVDIMVFVGLLLIAISLLGALYLWRRKLFETRWLLWMFVFSVLGPHIANQLGWVAAEVGRQPWIVYDLLRTSDALSNVVPASEVITSLILFGLIYLLLFVLFVFLLNEKIQQGPEDVVAQEGRIA